MIQYSGGQELEPVDDGEFGALKRVQDMVLQSTGLTAYHASKVADSRPFSAERKVQRRLLSDQRATSAAATVIALGLAARRR